jgi:hypothetical protein
VRESSFDHAQAIACPRCGYDQRGVVATWTEQCPLEGTCAECGLSYEWRELLNPRLTLPRWFVEAEQPRRRFVRQTLATFVRSFVPWRFWSSVRMSHPQRPRRIATYVALCLLLLYACFACAHGLLVWSRWQQSAGNFIGLGVAPPGGQPSTGGLAVFLHGALVPFSTRAIGQFTFGNITMGFAAPAASLRYWQGVIPLMLFALSTQAVCGLAFALLPISRRRAQVKWSHIVRATTYGLALFLSAMVMAMLLAGLRFELSARSYELLAWLVVGMWLMLPVMLIVWWSTATSRYLRMPHAWLVGVSVVILGLLTPFTIVQQ